MHVWYVFTVISECSVWNVNDAGHLCDQRKLVRVARFYGMK